MAPKLRPYQRKAIRQIKAAPERRKILALATGAGKTNIAVALAKGVSRTLFLVWKLEQVTQAVARLVEAGVPRSDIGITRGTSPGFNPTARFQVASVLTLVRRELAALGDFPLVILDEAHHAPAKSCARILQTFPDAQILGLTATPCRLDGKGLGDFFDRLILGPDIEDLVDGGWLARVRCFTVPEHLRPVMRGVKLRGGEFDQGAVDRAVRKSKLVGSLIVEWTKHASGLPTLAFCANVKHASKVAAEFNKHGIRAEVIHGETPEADRAAILERLKAGLTKVVTNCTVFGEGLDTPWVRCVIMARPTASLTVFLQQVGRARRPHGNSPAIILDHAGNIHRHGPPSLAREWDLHHTVPRRRGVAPFTVCPACNEQWPAGTRVCPVCHAEIRGEEMYEATGTRGELVEMIEQAKREGWWGGLSYSGVWQRVREGWEPRAAVAERTKKPPRTHEKKRAKRSSAYGTIVKAIADAKRAGTWSGASRTVVGVRVRNGMAADVAATLPVRGQSLAEAIDQAKRDGVWGGASQDIIARRIRRGSSREDAIARKPNGTVAATYRTFVDAGVAVVDLETFCLRIRRGWTTQDAASLELHAKRPRAPTSPIKIAIQNAIDGGTWKGASYTCVTQRVNKLGWTLKDAVETPVGQKP